MGVIRIEFGEGKADGLVLLDVELSLEGVDGFVGLSGVAIDAG